MVNFRYLVVNFYRSLSLISTCQWCRPITCLLLRYRGSKYHKNVELIAQTNILNVSKSRSLIFTKTSTNACRSIFIPSSLLIQNWIAAGIKTTTSQRCSFPNLPLKKNHENLFTSAKSYRKNNIGPLFLRHGVIETKQRITENLAALLHHSTRTDTSFSQY